MPTRTWQRTVAAVAAGAMALAAPTVASARDGHEGARLTQTNLVADVAGQALLTDPNLINPWGLSAGDPPTATPLWVANNHTDTSTLYSGLAPTPPFVAQLLVVAVHGGPTGTVFNPTPDGFVVSDADGSSGPSKFLFATEAGTIVGWAPSVPPPPPSTIGETAVTTPGAVYKGLALASRSSGSFLYAANFASGAIDVFDASFAPVHRAGAFHDRRLPHGYAPFNVQELGGRIYVAYAKQAPSGVDEAAGRGRGFVDVYTSGGQLLHRLVRRGALNAPWGLALAPASWGRLAGALLVGNFGDGRINAYDPETGRRLGALRDAHGARLAIDGLWALRFGNGVAGTSDTLFFTAGPDDEQHGLLGTLTLADDDD